MLEPIESVRRLRGMSNLARTAGLLVALSVSLAGCATDTTTTFSPSPAGTEGYTFVDTPAPTPDGKGTDAEGCPLPLGPDDPHGDYVDFIYYNGRSYLIDGELSADAPEGALGRELGTVQCQLVGHQIQVEGYDLGSGDASYLDPGTPFFARVGQPTERQIVARLDDGRLIVYDVDGRGLRQ